MMAVATGPGMPSGALQVITLGAQDSLPYLSYQNSDGTWTWYGQLPDPNGIKFSALATAPGNPRCCFSSDWFLQVVTLGATDGLPYVIYQDFNGAWHWGGQLPDPGVRFTAITAATNAQPYVQVTGIGATDQAPYLIWQDAGGTWHWSGKLPDPPEIPFASVASGTAESSTFLDDPPPYLQVVGLGAQDHLPYLVWQNDNGNWYWGGQVSGVPLWAIAGDSTEQELLGLNDQELSVWTLVGLGESDSLPYAIYITPDGPVGPRGGSDYPPDPGIRLKSIAIGSGNDRQLQVIGIGARDSLPYLLWQERSGTWHWGGELPSSSGGYQDKFKALATGTGDHNNLQVILLGANDGLPYLIFQDNGTGHWGFHGYILAGGAT